MKKYKIGAGFLSLTLACSLVMPVSAEDYSNTEAWYAKCSQAQTSESGIKACQGFQEYQKNRRQDLQKNIESYNSSIASLQNDTSKMEKLAKEQKDLVANLQTQISEKEKSIELIEKNIEELDDKIEAKESEIEAWNDQIETRMKNEQTTIGTNMIIDLIMGSDSLSDMLRRISGVERITEDDQSQIKKLNKLKKELVLQQDEQKRLDKDAKNQKTELESQKQQATELEESYNTLVEQYQKQIAQLEAEKRSAQVDMNSIRDFVISTNFSGSIESVSGFVFPVQGGSKSAGTWAYPGGGLHLGLDWAAPIGTVVVAPASGVILYAAAPVGSNTGYLGNWSGYPAGGGNTIEMLCNVNGTLYAISFAHLSQNIYVSAGQSVSQGQTIALSGNSGNSSGAHTHVEVYNLGSMSVSDAVARFSSGADFAWGTGWSGTSTSCEAGKAAPCRERPEKFF
ncbi:murein hydrolase activator EnvC [uncultured Holdemanella sp.]|jgi:murein DD-endopeptidase MepM/ murein hydrolase activator NlpD|uniref:murein hydrolase activator EnvC family protein n=1 Tax=uncultured Holdemanella sp. TaxID=1763549 RepID=UPI0025EF9CB0|nr:peptidoglycan DD-metalloendopeptidase family protein [uncultured Holdemanella sp.]